MAAISGSSRRTLLVGAASGLAGAGLATGLATLTSPAPSSIGTNGAGPADWLNVVTQYGADPTGASDAGRAIANAMHDAAPGGTVYLPAGIYLISKPVSVPPAITVAGARGGTNGSDTKVSAAHGTVIKISGSFTSTLPVTAAIALLDCQAGGWPSFSDSDPGASIGTHLKDFFIDGQDAPALVDGIDAYGSVHSVRITDVAIYRVTGNGVQGFKNSSSTAADKSPDGWICERVLVQNASLHSFGNLIWQDGIFIACHAQGGNGGDGGDGFSIDQGPTRLIGCRSDFKNNAYTIDSFTTSGGFQPIILSACTSDQCGQNAFNIVNDRGQGTRSCDPVIIDGCQAVMVGAAGGGAGIFVRGAGTRVTVSNTHIWASTGSGPRYGAQVIADRNGNGAAQVRISGGTLNGQLAPVEYDGSAVDFYLGPDVTQYTGIVGQTSEPSAGWVPLTLRHGYGNSGAGPSLLARAVGDRIEIVGDLTVPSSPDVAIATLPTGYDVPHAQQLSVMVLGNASPRAASVLTPRVQAHGTPAALTAADIPAHTTRIYVSGTIYMSA